MGSSYYYWSTNVTTVVIVLIIMIGVMIGLAFIPANIARKKGYSYGGFYVFGLFLFIPALIVALLMEDKTVPPFWYQQQQRQQQQYGGYQNPNGYQYGQQNQWQGPYGQQGYQNGPYGNPQSGPQQTNAQDIPYETKIKLDELQYQLDHGMISYEIYNQRREELLHPKA